MTTLEKTEKMEETTSNSPADAEFITLACAPRQLSARDSEILLAALKNPPEPGAALLRAAKRYRAAKYL